MTRRFVERVTFNEVGVRIDYDEVYRTGVVIHHAVDIPLDSDSQYLDEVQEMQDSIEALLTDVLDDAVSPMTVEEIQDAISEEEDDDDDD